MREVSCAKLCLRYVIIYDSLSLALLLERWALHNGRRLRQNNTIRSSAAANGVRSTDDIAFPFQIEPTMLGFDLDFLCFYYPKGGEAYATYDYFSCIYIHDYNNRKAKPPLGQVTFFVA